MTEFSVVIPAYNSANCVAGAIESVLAQTHQDFEVIVVDDGSSDGTKEVVESFTDSRITCVHQDNSGVSRARNTGIARAKGEYIAFLDADDRWRPSKLTRTMAAFDARPESGLVYSQYNVVDASGEWLYVGGRIVDLGSEPSCYFSRLLLRNFIQTSTSVVRSECCHKIGGFDEDLRHAEDWDYWLRLARQYALTGIAEPLVDFTVMRGEKHLRKMSARDAQTARLQVVAKAQETGDVSQSVLRSAFAFAWLQGALIDLALGRVKSGERQLHRALEYESGLFSEHAELTFEHVIGIATHLLDGLQSFEPSDRFIRLVWALLPRGASSRRQMRKALSAFYASEYFRAHWRGDAQAVRVALRPMVANGPHWLTDRGFWSIAIEAYFGQRVGDQVRRRQQNRLQAQGH